MNADNPDARAIGLETVSGNLIGRDPRAMNTAELNALGHSSNSPLEAIRRNCLECCGGGASEVRKCPATICPLWPFRMGTNPLARRNLSAEQREAAQARAAAARAKRSAIPA
jgi:hypothetical protein